MKEVALEVTSPPSPATTISNGTVRATGAMPNGAAWMYQASTSYLSQLSSVTTLAVGAAAGDGTIQTAGGFAVNNHIQIDQGSASELRIVVAVAGTGPYALTLDRICGNNHGSGVQVGLFTSAGPADVAAEAGSNQPAVATGYALPTTSPVVYDTLGVTTGTTGRKGSFVRLVGALSSAFGTAPGTVTLPSLIIAYDEF
jgi:hypothetical protein